ncbi:MAG: CgeB family protein [Verrucomicrobiota bacterium]
MQGSVLYLGEDFEHSTSRQRACAFERLGWSVKHINPLAYIPKCLQIPALFNRIGQYSLPFFVEQGLLRDIENFQFDLVWVDGGHLISSSLLKKLAAKGMKLINFNHDDPFGGGEGNKWKVYLQSVPYYDVLVVVRDENVKEARVCGAKKVEFTHFSYDPIVHAPRDMTETEKAHWSFDVLFLGTWKKERGAFFKYLAQKEIPFVIYGDHWQKAPEFSFFKHAWKGKSLWGDDYARAIQSSRVCLGLVSKTSRDVHTTRSLEIPAIGGLLCAERTSMHTTLYKENEEALFWDSCEECVEVCRKALNNPSWASEIALAGHRKVQTLQLSHDAVISRILKNNV